MDLFRMGASGVPHVPTGPAAYAGTEHLRLIRYCVSI